MTKIKLTFLIAFAIISTTSFATTWDEPWQDKVIKEADYFVLGKIKSCNKTKGVTIEIKKLGGKELKEKITITDYYLLNLGSYSKTAELDFDFKKGEEYYFFIKKDSIGRYCIATPSAGYAIVDNGKVYATYRHSYHQALVPVDIYEKTMTAIFNNYHNLPYDKQYIKDFVNKNLSIKPAGFNESEIDVFFNQHVALECVYHLRLTDYYSEIIPFLNDTANFHNQVSAARALIAYNTNECKQELLKVISDTTRDNFVQVICIWTLSDFIPTELKSELEKLLSTASTKRTGFGGNIMDPRVGTHFPDVKTALESLIAML